MNERKSNSLKKLLEKSENKNIYEEAINQDLLKAKSNQKNSNITNRLALYNNPSNIKSINIINNNYNNIIINNKLTPNKKIMIEDKTFSINKKNYKFLTFRNKNNEPLKLIINNKEPKCDNCDIQYRYQLMLNEKNGLIKKLKNENDLFKSKNEEQYPNLATTASIKKNKSPEFRNIKDVELQNLRNKMKNIFSLQKKETKFDKNILLNQNYNNNINVYTTIKTYASKSNNHSQNKNIKNSSFNNNENIYNIKIIPPIQNKSIDLNSINNNYKLNTKLMLNHSLKNDLNLNNNKLSLDLNNNYNSIEADRNYKFIIKNPKLIYNINSINNINSNNEINNYNNSYNYNFNTSEDIRERRPLFKNLKYNRHYLNKLTSPLSLKNQFINKRIIDSNSSTFNNNSCENSSSHFNYKENYENLKKRMANLIDNLFKIIETQNNEKNKC
jgi:hypothetical protein